MGLFEHSRIFYMTLGLPHADQPGEIFQLFNSSLLVGGEAFHSGPWDFLTGMGMCVFLTEAVLQFHVVLEKPAERVFSGYSGFHKGKIFGE